MVEGTLYTIEPITELDLIAMKDPTSVWLLRHDVDVEELKCYEQWEKHKPFKAKAIYHHPSGVDFYMKNDDDPFGVRDTDTNKPVYDELSLVPERPGHRHQVKEGEDIYSIARHYKLPWQKILEHNEMPSVNVVRPDMWIYIPTSYESRERQDIEYRLLEEPRPMHISQEGGTSKYSFGGVKKLTDIKPELKHYDQNHNVTIHAIAKVPIEDDLYAYYMDKHDLGNYTETSRVAYTRGYNWRHLAEGHITVETPASKVETIVADAMAEDDRPALPDRHEIAPAEPPVEREIPETPPTETPEEVATPPLEVELDEYKNTFKYLNIEESPEQFRLLETMDIRELDGARLPIHRKADSPVMVSGWFMYKGTPYYRVATRYWYAIPTQLAYSVEDDPFNSVSVDLPTRVAHNLALTREERRIATLSKMAARYNKVKSLSGLLRRK